MIGAMRRSLMRKRQSHQSAVWKPRFLKTSFAINEVGSNLFGAGENFEWLPVYRRSFALL